MGKRKIFIFCACITSGIFGCSTLMQLNMFPVTKDRELGQQFDAEIRSHPKEYPILKNHPEVKTYIANIGKKILQSPEIQYKNQFAYQFEVIDDDSTVNAFCTPGGYVYVYTGLLKFVDDEASLAGIIAHEIAHAERRHSTNKITTQYGIEAALGLASGKLGETGTQIASTAAGLGLLKFSRTEELEADNYSFKYLQATEYFPGAIKSFFVKIGTGSRGGIFESFLSTHPLPQDRFDNIDKLLAQAGNPKASEKNLFAERYKKFKRTLP